MKKTSKTTPPVLILDGSHNALSITRSLGRRGIQVYNSLETHKHALFSRYCAKSFPFTNRATAQKFWGNLLLTKQGEQFFGSVILTCGDEGIEFVAHNRQALAQHFILDDSVPELQLAMLDKKKTLCMASALGISIPHFWDISTLDDLEAIASEVQFPAIVKPIHSHLFQQLTTSRKYFRADSQDELRTFLQKAFKLKLQVMICELIPGPDSLLGSYYTYLDATGRPLFHFTKKVIRRYPKNEGLGCYHSTDWNEELAELGLRFFQGIGFRGLGNIEFKRDERDGQLKVIEVNPRFTAAQELLVQAGIDIGVIVYNHLVGLPVPKIVSYNQNLRLWFPIRDFYAYLELREKREITFWGWIKSLMHRQVLPYFQWSDPLPTIRTFLISLKSYLNRKMRILRIELHKNVS
ncbi:carboxylate--amine ligase [candidate division KSB3 bacterium]|uniref:Carboxylate--amine ligase n=1 Tax=candidate division KSB3 bacterium TaxID=2044937 RepID=A0A2G6KI89_9BACT|nr:MAG: carboxylate--amine ligase [candidate division KSB3 bacterium]